MSFKVILVRHGTSETYENRDEEADIFRQSPGTKLGPIGEYQAHLLGKQISVYRPDVLFSSAYIRARKTAEVVAEYSPLFVNVDERLNEISRSVDGKSIYSEENLAYKKWRGEAIRNLDLNSRFSPLDMSFGELWNQAVDFGQYLVKDFDFQTIVVVSHSQLLGFLMTYMVYGPKAKPKEIFGFFNTHFMSNGGYTIVEYNRKWIFDERKFNITSHLI